MIFRIYLRKFIHLFDGCVCVDFFCASINTEFSRDAASFMRVVAPVHLPESSHSFSVAIPPAFEIYELCSRLLKCYITKNNANFRSDGKSPGRTVTICE